MTIQTCSRFITYPSTVEKSNNHTVVLVDADESAVEDIGLFCKVSNKNYDIYLYRGDIDDLQWLAHISELSDHVLVAETSKLTSGSKSISLFGSNQSLAAPLDYFLQHEDN